MTQSESSKDEMQPVDGSSSRMRARTNRFMFSVELGSNTAPLATESGCGCQALMSALV